MTDFPSSPESATLLPCPFCGEQPKSYWQGCSEVGDDGYWAIECCHVHVHTDDEEDAVHDWNLREPPRGLAQRAPDRQAIAIMIREYLQKKYGTAAVRMSDGMERIYYSGVSLLDIADALADTPTGGNSE